MSGSRKITRVFVTLLTVLAVFTAWKVAELSAYHNRTPEGAGVGRVVYAKSKTFGFGPGGNETGIVVFELSAKSSAALKEDPDRFLASFAKSSERCRNYRAWNETPLIADETNISGTVQGEVVTLETFMNRYGFGISVSKKYAAMLDAALANKGSYIAGSRCGTFIFIPKEKLAAYIFVG